MFSRIFILLLLCIQTLSAFEPIDIVYTWVDGADLAWQELRNEYSSRETGRQKLSSDAVAARRFRDRNELKYSLRSLHKFAPWINHIYIVTCGQRPKWLADHPQITIVDHREIFPNRSHLPTFNSMAIECHLHKIPGLKEHYIYFNDDVFLGRNVTPEDFFTPEGKIKLFLSKVPLPSGEILPEDEGFTAACKNTTALLDATFGEHPWCRHAHTPFPSKKSLFSKIEQDFTQIFNAVSSHKFRSHHDFLITNGIIPQTALQIGQAEEAAVDKKTLHYGKDSMKENIKKLSRLLESRPLFFCIEDSSKSENSLENAQALQSFFEAFIPTPAPWEKTAQEPTLNSEQLLQQRS